MTPEKVDNGKRIAFEADGIVGPAGFIEREGFAELAYLIASTNAKPPEGEVLVEGRKWRIAKVERLKRPTMYLLRLDPLAS